jgi:predicted nucleic acid-binding protein
VSAARLIVAEPASAYQHRPRLVVDASVLAALVYDESNAQDAFAWMSGRNVCIPHIADGEIANVGLNKVRRRVLGLGAVTEALAFYETLDVQRYPIAVSAAMQLGHRYALSAYDAAYLWLAEMLAAPLATFDARLGEAAQRHLGGARGPG